MKFPCVFTRIKYGFHPFFGVDAAAAQRTGSLGLAERIFQGSAHGKASEKPLHAEVEPEKRWQGP